MKFIAITATTTTPLTQAWADEAFFPVNEFNPITIGELSQNPDIHFGAEIGLILDYMETVDDPAFHEEFEALFTTSDDHPYYPSARIRATKTSSGNVLVRGTFNPEPDYTGVVIACDSTRGRFNEQKEYLGVPVKQLLEDQSDWFLYETTGPMRPLGDGELGYVTSQTILPWESQGDFIIRTRDNVHMSPNYRTVVDNALRMMGLSESHRLQDMFPFEDGQYRFAFSDAINGAQTQTLHHFFNSDDYEPSLRRQRIDAAKRYLELSRIGVHLLREI